MKYISLKEAASMSGYSADYIGQLIRAGKLEGKQVFSNVSWVTTEDAIRDYLEKDKKSAPKESLLSHVKALLSSTEGLAYIYTVVSWFAIGFFVAFAIILIAILGISADHYMERKTLDKINHVQ